MALRGQWVWARLLAGERQQQQHGQVPQAAEEELAGGASVSSPVETEGQVDQVQVNRQRHKREGPGGHVQKGRQSAQAQQGQAVAQRHPLAHSRVGDGHHAVAAAGVVLPQVPAEGVEVRKLPAVEEGGQQYCTCRGRTLILMLIN